MCKNLCLQNRQHCVQSAEVQTAEGPRDPWASTDQKHHPCVYGSVREDVLYHQVCTHKRKWLLYLYTIYYICTWFGGVLVLSICITYIPVGVWLSTKRCSLPLHKDREYHISYIQTASLTSLYCTLDFHISLFFHRIPGEECDTLLTYNSTVSKVTVNNDHIWGTIVILLTGQYWFKNSLFPPHILYSVQHLLETASKCYKLRYLLPFQPNFMLCTMCNTYKCRHIFFQHIAVFRKGVLYRLEMYDKNGRLLTPTLIQKQLDWIINDADKHTGTAVDLFTSHFNL